MRIVLILFLLAPTASAQSMPEVRTAVTRALPLLQRSAAEFVSKRACFSCHHNGLPILTLHFARDRGFAIDSAVLDAVEEKTFRQLRNPNALDDAIQAATLSDPTPNESYLLMAAHAAGIESDITTQVYARRLAGWQRDGHWVTTFVRHTRALYLRLRPRPSAQFASYDGRTALDQARRYKHSHLEASLR
ncbi:MAG: hypothetical protein AUG12_04345 [Acidobacteria bacterium 13_1_20CM_2_57_8]|nr:MAG: hypothetical protein AUG12_04345 [Acidobacteria bacterium 13_1_20CM_2_57_8]